MCRLRSSYLAMRSEVLSAVAMMQPNRAKLSEQLFRVLPSWMVGKNGVEPILFCLTTAVLSLRAVAPSLAVPRTNLLAFRASLSSTAAPTQTDWG